MLFKKIKPTFNLHQKKPSHCGLNLINHYFKNFFKLILFIVVPIFIIVFLAFGVIIAITSLFPKSPSSSSIQNFFFTNFHVQPLNNDGLITWVVNAMSAVLYLLFIRPIVWILDNLQTIIYYISGGELINLLFKGRISTANHLFYVSLGIAGALIFFALAYKLLSMMFSGNFSAYNYIFKNIIITIIGVVVTPFVFLAVNEIVIICTQIFISQTDYNNLNLSVIIFNSSFSDGLHHFAYVADNWFFPDSQNFLYLVCLVAEFIIMYLILIMTIFLLWRIGDMVILYAISPYFIFMAITDNGQLFNRWKDQTLVRFASFSFVYFGYSIFILSIPIISEVAKQLPDLATPIFILIALISFSIVAVKAPELLMNVIGINSGTVMESIFSFLLAKNAVNSGMNVLHNTSHELSSLGHTIHNSDSFSTGLTAVGKQLIRSSATNLTKVANFHHNFTDSILGGKPVGKSNSSHHPRSIPATDLKNNWLNQKINHSEGE